MQVLRYPGAIEAVDYILKLFRKNRVGLGAFARETLGMAGNDAYPGGGPSRIDTAQVQAPPRRAALGVSLDGTL